jgi:hypothetical protein
LDESSGNGIGARIAGAVRETAVDAVAGAAIGAVVETVRETREASRSGKGTRPLRLAGKAVKGALTGAVAAAIPAVAGWTSMSQVPALLHPLPQGAEEPVTGARTAGELAEPRRLAAEPDRAKSQLLKGGSKRGGARERRREAGQAGAARPESRRASVAVGFHTAAALARVAERLSGIARLASYGPESARASRVVYDAVVAAQQSVLAPAAMRGKTRVRGALRDHDGGR